MPSIPRLSDLDAGAWRMATLSVPFVVQIVLGLELAAMWALGMGPFTTESGRSERTWMFTATVITTLVSLVVSALLLRSASSRNRGLGLSVAASAVVVIVGGTVYACLILR
jgi:NO-binding membrane sensor protein with MHYT domain